MDKVATTILLVALVTGLLLIFLPVTYFGVGWGVAWYLLGGVCAAGLTQWRLARTKAASWDPAGLIAVGMVSWAFVVPASVVLVAELLTREDAK